MSDGSVAGVEDTWAALKALKAKKAKNNANSQTKKRKIAEPEDEVSEASDNGNSEEDNGMTAEDTWAALKAAKAKKANGGAASSKASAEKHKAEPESDLESELSDEVDADTLTVDDTWAALKAAKEKKRKGGDNDKPSKSLKSGKTKETRKIKDKAKKAPIPTREKQLMAQDEEEMDYWRKKLKLKSYKVPKGEIDDGLDDILGGLDFDHFSEADSDASDWLDDDEDKEDASSDSEMESYEDSEEESEEEKPAPKPRENPYVAPVPAAPTAGKYIPPAKRAQMAAQSGLSEEEIKLQKLVRGHLNKMAEANIGTIVNEIERLYHDHPRQLVTEAVTNIVIQSTAMQSTLLESFLVIHAALVVALFKTVGVEFGAHFVQTLVEKFDYQFQELMKDPSSSVTSKQASNLLSLISECYAFQLVSCKLMYDIVRMFQDDLSEVKTEFLLKVVRTSGPQMRSDDPGALKEIIYQLQLLVSKADKDSINTRTKFLIESVTALKNNRAKPASDVTAATSQRMKKFLGSIHGVASDPLQVSLDDIRNVKERGKWWLVGAAWTGRNAANNGPDHDIEAVNDILDSAEPNWMELARQQRMNTDVRSAVFIALMSSEDYVDAFDRLQRLKLKSKQEREIPRVTLHCCGNEQVYNPFYALVAGKLCQTHSLKKTFQFSLWDYISELQGDDEEHSGRYANDDDEMRIRRISHFARFYASLVAQGSMTLDLLKTVNFLEASSHLSLFLGAFFVALFQTMGKRAEGSDTGRNMFSKNVMFEQQRSGTELAAMLVKTKDMLVLEGMRYFLPKVLKSSAMGTKQKSIDRVKWGVNLAHDMIDEILSNRQEMPSD